MWHDRRGLSGLPLELNSEAVDLLESAAQNMIKGVTLLYVTLQFLLAASMNNPKTVNFSVYTILIVLLTGYIALKKLPLIPALTLWQVGFVVAIAIIVRGFQQPALGFFYILLPFFWAVTGSRKACLITTCVLIILIIWDGYSPLGEHWLSPYGLEIIAGLLFAASMNWLIITLLGRLIYWSLSTQKQAREVIEKSREERLEFKQVQEDLIRANQELASLSNRLKVMHHMAEEGRQAKAEFVANVSHELRTPLNMIIGFSEMISKSPELYGIELPQALLLDVSTIQRNSQHLAKLVDDVLDLSQVDAGRMALSKEWANVPKILEEAVTTVKPLFDSKGLYLEVEIEGDLPPVFCDGIRIRQIVLNLLSNAIRFTEQGGVRVKIWRQGNEAIVSVMDTGPGITPEDQSKLFEPFQQADNSIRRRYGGSGLGLNISKRFVEMHGGRMWLESKINVGTTLLFSLPLTLPEPSDLSENVVAGSFNPYFEFRARTDKRKPFRSTVLPRFVLMEKGQILARWFERYVEGIEAIHVQNADEAIRELTHLPAQALIVNASSLEPASEELRKLDTLNLPYPTPILRCHVPDEVEAAERLGIMRYLVKPVTRDALLLALESLGENIRTVLLVDDTQEVLRLFSRMLSAAPQNYRVLRATSGTRALSLLRERKPDAVVLDLIMPDMDGFGVLQEMKLDLTIRDIPVIVVTSQDPIGEPIMSDSLTLSRQGGLSARDLIACIQAVSGILAGQAELSAQTTH